MCQIERTNKLSRDAKLDSPKRLGKYDSLREAIQDIARNGGVLRITADNEDEIWILKTVITKFIKSTGVALHRFVLSSNALVLEIALEE